MDCAVKLDATYPSYCDSRDGNRCTIQPDPDIAGIGVLASFITVGLLVILSAFYQVWRNERNGVEWKNFYRPVNDFRLESGNQPVLRKAKEYLAFERDHQVQKSRTPALSATIFSLADTQFITGIAIAGAMSKKDIVLAHFHVADEMAWLGFISATAGLLTTRVEILDKGNNAKRLVRVVIMWAYLGLLIHRAREFNDALLFAEKVHENNSPTPQLRWNFMDRRSRVSLFLLIWSIVGAVVDTVFLWPDLAVVMYYYATKAVTRPYGFAKDRWRELPQPVAVVCWFVWICLYVVALGLYLMFFEPFSYNIGNLGFFIWGVTKAIQFREIGQSCMSESDRPKEDELGFGQMVALILLLAPVINSADLWWAKSSGNDMLPPIVGKQLRICFNPWCIEAMYCVLIPFTLSIGRDNSDEDGDDDGDDDDWEEEDRFDTEKGARQSRYAGPLGRYL